MHFNNVATLFTYIKHVNVSIFTIGMNGFNFIHGFALNEADVNFLKIFTKVFIRYEKNSIVPGKRNLRTV